jgi:hypothetical protein
MVNFPAVVDIEMQLKHAFVNHLLMQFYGDILQIFI